MGWFPCCCLEDPLCVACIGDPPTSVTVICSGFNPTCSNLNLTHICTKWDTDGCVWEFDFADPFGVPQKGRVFLNAFGEQVRVRDAGFNNNIGEWWPGQLGKVDCKNFNQLLVQSVAPFGCSAGGGGESVRVILA